MANVSLLNIPSAWTHTNGLRNLLLKPLQLIHQWSRFSNLSLPDRANQIFKDVKKFDQFLGAISFAFQLDRVFNKGPKMKGSYLVKGEQQPPKFEDCKYSNYKTHLWTERVGFASKVLKAVTYFFPSQKQNIFLSRIQDVADLGCAVANFYLEIQLRKQLWGKNQEQIPSSEEKTLSNCRILMVALTCSQIVLKQMPNQKALKLPHLILLTAMTANAYFSHFYDEWNIRIHRK